VREAEEREAAERPSRDDNDDDDDDDDMTGTDKVFRGQPCIFTSVCLCPARDQLLQ